MSAETEFYVTKHPDIWFFVAEQKNSKILDFMKGFPQCIQDMTGLALGEVMCQKIKKKRFFRKKKSKKFQNATKRLENNILSFNLWLEGCLRGYAELKRTLFYMGLWEI